MTVFSVKVIRARAQFRANFANKDMNEEHQRFMQMEKLLKCGLLDVGLTDQTALTYAIRHKLLCLVSLGVTLEMLEDKGKIYEKVVDLVKAEILKVDAADTEEKLTIS